MIRRLPMLFLLLLMLWSAAARAAEDIDWMMMSFQRIFIIIVAKEMSRNAAAV
jgi:hypothetical protein